MSPTNSDLVLEDNPEKRRLEAHRDGELVGFVDYIDTGEIMVLTHTEVDRAMEGQGVGGALARGSLELVRERGRTVMPLCPFIKGWMTTHPDFDDLVYRAAPSTVTD